MHLSTLKASSFSLALALTTLGLLPACDVVTNPQPVQTATAPPAPVPGVPTSHSSRGRGDTLVLDSLERTRPVPALTQGVLLEDFTGQYCGNCPGGGRVVSQLLQQYGERLTVVEEHVTEFFAAPKSTAPYLVDYRVPGVAQELENTYGISSLPKGAVNRAHRPGRSGLVLEAGEWAASVVDRLAQTPQQQLRVTPLYDPKTRLLRLKVNTAYLTAQPGRTFRLGIFISEDSLVGGQKDYSFPGGQQDRPDYVHRHVLRVALAGTFGTVQLTGPIAGQQVATYLRYQLPGAAGPPAWDPRHCAVVAYLSNDSDREVQQVASVRLTGK